MLPWAQLANLDETTNIDETLQKPVPKPLPKT